MYVLETTVNEASLLSCTPEPSTLAPRTLPDNTRSTKRNMADVGHGDDLSPRFAPFLGMAGIAFAMIFGCTNVRCTRYKRSRH